MELCSHRRVQERLLAEMVLPGPETPQRTVQETVGIPRIYRYQSGQAPWQHPLQCVQYEQWIHGRAIGRLLQTIIRIYHTQPGDLHILGASFRLGKLTYILCKFVSRLVSTMPVGSTLAYVDDILLHSKDASGIQMVQFIDQFLTRVEQSGAKIQVPKTALMKTQVNYLGFIVGLLGITMN